jgi:hypothetical protein
MRMHPNAVIPATAGTQTGAFAETQPALGCEILRDWVPAFAGMTDVGSALA